MRSFKATLVIFLMVFLLFPSLLLAEEDPATDSSAATVQKTSATSSIPKNDGKTKKKKGRVAREKDAAGTKAPNRFDTSDIVIKSKYEYNGQPLEVDTE